MPPPEKLKCKIANAGRGRTDGGNTICPFHHSSNGRGIKSCSSYDHLRKLKRKLLMPSRTWVEADGRTVRRMDEQG